MTENLLRDASFIKLSMADIKAARVNIESTRSSLAYEATCGKIFTLEGYEKTKDSTATPIIEITPSKILECINLISGPGSSSIYEALSSLEAVHDLTDSCLAIKIECTSHSSDIITAGCWKNIEINAVGCLHDLRDSN